MEYARVLEAPPAPSVDLLPNWLDRPHKLREALIALARSFRLARHGVVPRAGEPYARTVLHRDARGEVMLATWSEGQACAPHDHGASSGAVLVLEGTFVETSYRMDQGQLEATWQREHGPLS